MENWLLLGVNQEKIQDNPEVHVVSENKKELTKQAKRWTSIKGIQ
jgi:hypothetical protein